MGNRAISAVTGAYVSQDQEGRSPVVPTLTNVGAVGLLADSVKPQVLHQTSNLGIILPAGSFDLEPVRLAMGLGSACGVTTRL